MFDFFNNENANQLAEQQITMADTFIIGTEFRVNTYTTSNQHNPYVTGLSNSNFVVTWASLGQDDGTYDGVYGQRYDAAGNLQDSEFQVNSYTTNTQGAAVLTGLINGGFVVTWQSAGQDGDQVGIFSQRYDSSGLSQGSEFQVNSYTTNGQVNPSITALQGGGFVIMWQSLGQDGDGPTYTNVYGQLYNSIGNIQGSNFIVNTYSTNTQANPSVASLTNGCFVVVWESFGQDGDAYGIYAQRYDSSGVTIGNEFQVNTYTTNDQKYSSVAEQVNGGFVVTWQSYGQDGDSDGIFGQLYDTAGSTKGSEFQINTYTTQIQTRPRVTALSNIGFVVVWKSNGQDSDNYGVYGKCYDTSGNVVDTEFLINTYITGGQNAPSTTALKNGSFVVAWSSPQDGDNSGIYAKIFTLIASPAPPLSPMPQLHNSNILFTVLGIGSAAILSAAVIAYAKYRNKKSNDAEKLADTEMGVALYPMPRNEIPVQTAETMLPDSLELAVTQNLQASSHSSNIELEQDAVSPPQDNNFPPTTIKTPRDEEGRPPSGSVVSILPASYLIPYNQLTFGKILGQGAYGVVYQGSWQHSEVAIKQLLLTSLTEKARAEIEKEAEVMAGLRHANVVTFYGASIDHPGKYSLVMELMPLGNLFNLLHTNQPLAWDVRLSIARDITAGLEHLHSKGILHRDLKSLNVLLGYGMRAKLTDFGLAKIKSETASKTAAEGGGSKGTVAWMAPEQFMREYTQKTDVYSYGMVLWELAARAVPYEDASNPELVKGWIKDGIQETIPEDCPEQLAKLIKWCWEKEPNARPTIARAAEELKSDTNLQTEMPDTEPNYHENLNTQFGL